MDQLPPALEQLIQELSRLPSVGPKTAQRLAFHILRVPDDEALALADAIREVKERIGLCEVCFNLADGPRCRICLDERRDGSIICVVEEPGDVIPIERTHEFPGRYHVLGGALSPIDGVDPEDLKIAELYARVAAGTIREVVLATNPTTTGEATALHIAAALQAGADLLSLSGTLSDQEQAAQAVVQAVRSGRIPRARVQEALLRVLALKRRYVTGGSTGG